MKHYELEATFTYVPFAEDESPMDEFVDQVHDHLIDLAAEDATIMLDATTRTITLSILVSANEEESTEATIGRGMGFFRTAFHSCGASTPAWPSPGDLIFGGVRLEPVEVTASAAGDSGRELTAA